MKKFAWILLIPVGLLVFLFYRKSASGGIVSGGASGGGISTAQKAQNLISSAGASLQKAAESVSSGSGFKFPSLSFGSSSKSDGSIFSKADAQTSASDTLTPGVPLGNETDNAVTSFDLSDSADFGSFQPSDFGGGDVTDYGSLPNEDFGQFNDTPQNDDGDFSD